MAWTTAKTWVDDVDVLSASNLNTHVRDNQRALTALHSTYTPTWTASSSNPSLGTGTINGYYRLTDLSLTVHIRLTMGSTTTYGSGAWYFSFPNDTAMGWTLTDSSGICYDSSGSARWIARADHVDDTKFAILTHGSTSRATSSIPVAWGTSDTVHITGTWTDLTP